MKRLFRKFYPERFQGSLSNEIYFEGWYYKLVNKAGDFIIAFIPGISLDKKNKTSHSFIQVLNGITCEYRYINFPENHFKAKTDEFRVSVGKNVFTSNSISLDISSGKTEINGTLLFSSITGYPSSFFRPGIMSWLTWFPFLECSHGIINLDYKINGVLNIDGRCVDFSEGRGYLEKDWGRSFPSHWIWMQSNHFSKPGNSFVFSLAKMPLIFFKIKGFFAVLHCDGKTYTFATHNGFLLKHRHIKDRSFSCVIENRRFKLEVMAFKNMRKSSDSALMKAPVNGCMEYKCVESMTSAIKVRLSSKKTGKTVFEDTGSFAGLEIMGTDSEL
ncbi:MAG: tocopherol cyclase family protein [bacterium]